MNILNNNKYESQNIQISPWIQLLLKDFHKQVDDLSLFGVATLRDIARNMIWNICSHFGLSYGVPGCTSRIFERYVAALVRRLTKNGGAGALMVMTYPHFLFADSRYRNGVIGMRPDVENHRIFVDLEPNTGTVIRGMKRAQFNVFMRPVTSIPATQPLRTTLMPILWVEEGMDLPDEYADMVKNRLLANLRLVDILVPVVIAISCVVLLLGVGILIRVKTMSSPKNIRLTN